MRAISGRVLIELRNVFPGEASPSDLLCSAWRADRHAVAICLGAYLNED